MGGNEHERRVQSTIIYGALGRSEWAAAALLLPRVALGWTSLQLGWGAMQFTPLPPLYGECVLALGLTLSGIALVLGVLTGPVALCSGALGVAAWEQSNTATTSAMLALAVLLVFNWHSAGQIGLDRWLLPSLGLARYRSALVTRERSRR